MNDLDFPALILDSSNDIVYLSDIDTYQLYYINETLKANLGNPPEELWKNATCYTLLQGLDKPCTFCTNKMLVTDKPYLWTHYNPLSKSWYSLMDRKIEYKGKNLRLEVAREIDDIMNKKKELYDIIQEERILVDCVGLLNSQSPPQIAIHKLLELIAAFHDADRAYVFEIDLQKELAHNTLEWCKAGIIPEISNLQHKPLNHFKYFLELFKIKKSIAIKDLDNSSIRTDKPELYEKLKEYNINSFIITPIKNAEGDITGILGVENPRLRFLADTLLSSLSYFISDYQQKQLILDRLHNLSYTDSITSLKNSHSYRIDMEEYAKYPPHSCGIAFIDINGLKEVNDTYGHEAGDNIIKKLGTNLLNLFLDKAYRTGGDEFIVISPDCGREEFLQNIALLESTIANEERLEISIGKVWTKDLSLGVKHYVNQTDKEMYEKKKEFYAKKDYDRRSRN